LEETRSTLQFASRAKLVTTHATVNEFLDDAAKLKRLQKELNELKDKQKHVGISPEEYQSLESDKATLQQQLTGLMEENEAQKVSCYNYNYYCYCYCCYLYYFTYAIIIIVIITLIVVTTTTFRYIVVN
jgi:hypothetical protein